MSSTLSAQTVSVVEWDFASTTSPLNASVTNFAVQTTPVVLQANGGISLTQSTTGTVYEGAGTAWAGTEDAGFTAARTSLTPRAAKSLSTNFTLSSLANGDWSNLSVSFKYQRPTTAPTRARAVITWQDAAGAFKRCYTSSITLSGTAWSTVTAKFAAGDALPTTLTNLPCLVELYFWGTSSTPNGVNLDDLKLVCNSLANAYSIYPATLRDWEQNRAYSAQFSVPSFSGTATWSSTGTLPPGLLLNASTGELAGTPSTIGSYTFSVAVSGTGLSASKSLTLNIVAPATALPAGNSVAKLTFDSDTTANSYSPVPPADVAACYSELSFGYDAAGTMSGSIHAGGKSLSSGNPINPALGGQMRCFVGWDASYAYATTRNSLTHFNVSTTPSQIRFGVYPDANTASIPTASQTNVGENSVWQTRIKLDPNSSGDLQAFYFDALRWQKDLMDVSGINGPRWAELHAYWTDDAGAIQRWDSPSIDIKAVYQPEHRAVNQFGRYVVNLDNGVSGLNQRIKSTTSKYRSRTVFFDLYLWHDTGADLTGIGGTYPPVILIDEMGIVGNFVCTTPKVGIGNTVFNDANYNGRFDPGEGIAGVAVELLDPIGTVLQSTTTTSGGNYLFADLAEGSYKVRIPASEFASGKTLYQMTSVTGVGGDDGLDDDVGENGIDDPAPATNGISSATIALRMDSEPTTTESGNNTFADSADDDNTDLTVDFGFVTSPLFGLGNRVFRDKNGNGTYDPGEGVDGVAVELLSSTNAVLDTQTTSNGGRYFFAGQPSNQTYYVRVAASNFAAGGLLRGLVSVTGNGIDNGVDNDDNGVDDTASVANGIKSTLITPDANQGGSFGYSWPPNVAAAVNNDGGTWYQVSARQNYVTKLLDVSVTLDTTTQNTQALWMVITNGVTPASADTNYAALYLANGFVFVTPYLASPTTTHSLGTVITTTTYTVTTVGTLKTFKFTLNLAAVNQWAGAPATWLGTGFPTDAKGGYPDLLNKKIGLWIRSFADGSATLSGGTWTVNWGKPFDPDIGSYDDVEPLTEIGCDNTIDFGFQQSDDYGDFSGFASASSSVSTNLRLGAQVEAEAAAALNATATGDDLAGIDDEDGAVVPSSINTGASVTIPVTVFNNTGNVAYLNAWLDFNNDGVLSDTLLSAGGEKLMAEQTVSSSATAQTINVTFTVPNTASLGTNRGLRFRLTSVSAPTAVGYVGFGEVEDYALSIAAPVLTIGNLVWNDTNNNGLKDVTELGVGGVSVALYQPGADTLANTADDVFVASTTTSVLGAYQFPGLVEGNYFVKVSLPSAFPLSGGAPATTDNNVDGNNDGSQPGGSGTALFSPVVNLTLNTESTTDGDSDANTNLTIDFGLFSGFTVGNLVFADTNNNGALDFGESGISGLSVELLNATTNAVVATTTTNGSGFYGFQVYVPGTYKVRVTPNASFPLASSSVGTDNGTDNRNDGTQTGTAGSTSVSFPFTLSGGSEPGSSGSGNTENTIDFGFRPCSNINVTPASIASGTTGVNVNINVSASGGKVPYRFAVTSGSLPLGLALNTSTGLINGAPTTAATYTFQITATDADGCKGTTSITWLIRPPPSIDFGDYSGFGSAGSTVDARLRMGALVDAEYSPILNISATGDDNSVSDDEDGMTLPEAIAPGLESTVKINVTNTTGAPAYLNVWVDYNQNGLLTDVGEQVATNVLVSNGSVSVVNDVVFTPPSNVGTGFVGIRARLTSAASPGSIGTTSVGEVEDWLLRVCPSAGFAYGTGWGNLYEINVSNGTVRVATAVPAGFDAANGAGYAATLGADGAVIFATGLSNDMRLAVWDRTTGVINVAGDLTTFGVPSGLSIHSGDYYNGFYYMVIDDTDDLWKVGISGSSGAFTITSATKVCDLFSNTKAHRYGDIVITPAGILYAHATNVAGGTDFYTADLNAAVPAATVLGRPPYMHNGITLGIDGKLYGGLGVNSSNADWFQVSLANGGSTYLNAGFINGLTDMTMGACNSSPVVNGTPTNLDYGDYAGFASASSGVNTNIKLGALVDIDTTITSDLDALGDDQAGTDDEDGATLPATIQAGSTISVPVVVTNTTATNAYLNAWVDLNGNGLLTDPGEQFIANVVIPAGTSAVTQNYSLAVPLSSFLGQVGVRFRITSTSAPPPTGRSGSGEVEDYLVTIACPTISVGPASLPLAYVNTSYSAQLSATGGTSPYTWAVTTGALPSGITLNATSGLISGTAPATTSNTPIVIQATDAVGCIGQTTGMTFQVLSMTIGNMVFNDVNCNGLLDPGEPGIAGITVQLYGLGTDAAAYTSDDVLLKTVTTGADGSYRFDGLAPGTYWVKVTPTTAYAFATLGGVNLDNSVDNDSNANQVANGGSAIRSPVITLTANAETTAEDGDPNTDLTVDFGLRQSFRVGDQIWSDVNDNGIREPSEAGLSGVSVNLMSPGANGVIGGGDDTIIMSTSTNGAGNYFFTVPVTGNFFIRVTPPAGYDVPSFSAVTLDNGVNDDSNGSQPGGATTYIYSPIFSLAQCKEPGTSGTTNDELTIDVGLVPNTMGIGNLVFRDDNGNGHADPGEGLDGITVQLYRSTDTPGVSTPLATTTTGGGGYYQFINLARGQYYVHIPASMFGTTGLLKGTFSVTGAMTNNADDDVGEDGVDSATPETTGITSRLVTLRKGTAPTDATTETGLNAGSDNTLSGGDADNDFTVDFGFYRWVGVGNLVFYDANGDGKAQATEGVDGVTVQLYTTDQKPGVNTPVATTVTANGGKYLFMKQKPGIYVLHIPATMFAVGKPLAGKMSIADGKFGDDDVGEDGLNDGNPSVDGVSTAGVFIVAGVTPTASNGETGVDNASDDTVDAAVDLTVDFGFQDPVSVGNLVFFDTNNNGRYDTGEGVDGVTVQLYRSGSVAGGSVPVATVQTSGGGRYKFSNLSGGTYFVHLPASNFSRGGVLFDRVSISGVATANTDDDVGEDGLDSASPITTGISSADVTLLAGSMPTNAGTEKGFQATDDDANLQDGNGNMTIDFGFVPPDPNRVGVGNTVFNDLNGNGKFDDGEGIDGVSLELYNAITNVKVATTTTASGGLYLFGNLAPASYYVKIPATNWSASGALNGKLPLAGQGGDDGTDDDLDENGDDPASPSTTGVRSNNFTLSVHGEPTDFDTEFGNNTFSDVGFDDNYDLTIDFGFYERCGVGNLVFVDANGNGKADLNEGVAGVTVQLFRAGQDPVVDTPVATQVTETTRKGFFMFLDLYPGAYFLHIPASMFQTGGALLGKTSMTGVESTSVDDNAGEDGIDPSDITSQGIDTGIFFLRPGSMPAGTTEAGQFSTADNSSPNGISGYNIDLTRDFGFLANACVGNLVFKDLNRDGKFTSGTDVGVDGVTVELWKGTTRVATTTTANGGRYGFCVPAGSYSVRIPASMFQTGAPLANTQATTLGTMSATTGTGGNATTVWQDDGAGQDASDGGNPVANGAATAAFTLAVGTMPGPTTGETGFDSASDNATETDTNLTIDLGFRLLPLNVGNLVFKDTNSNGKLDVGEVGDGGVTVKLFPLGADPQTATATATAITATNGTYLLTAYAEGQYFVHVPKSNFASTGPLKGMNSSPGFGTGVADDNVSEDGLDAVTPSTTGVSSSIISLVYGAMPTDMSGEAGFQASSDNSDDVNGNMTIDFGFRVPPVGTPLAGRVRAALTTDATVTVTATPITGVQVSAFVDANHNGILDANESNAVATATTNANGSYLIEGLKSDVYVVQAQPLPGSVAVADTDGGLPDQTSVVLGTKPVGYIDFVQCPCPDTFSQWQSQHALAGRNKPDENPDADGADNLLEYALNTDPASGVQAVPHFRLEATAGIDAVLIRSAQGHKDLRYNLEGSADLKQWTTLTTTSKSTADGDDEILRFAGIARDPAFASAAIGYVRLRVELDADLNGVAEASSTSPVYAFALSAFGPSQTTFSMPLLRDELYSGTVTSTSSISISIAQATGLKVAIGSGRECFVEVVSGDLAGQCFDLDEAATTDTKLAIDTSRARNTVTTVDASLVGARVVVRPHWTLGALLPVTAFHATTSPATADRVSFFENGAYAVHWALAKPQGIQWLSTGDTTVADSGLTRIITPQEGFYVQARGSAVTVPVVGLVRNTPLLRKVVSSLQMIGTGAAQAVAPTSLKWTTTGDKLRVWLGDTVSGSTAFDALTKSASGWLRDADGSAVDSALILAPFRAVFHEPAKASVVGAAQN